MNPCLRVCRNLYGIAVLAALLAVFSSSNFARAEEQWQQPTPEELSMTGQPQVPGAAAVYLYREETTDDELHMRTFYVRLKVLTEAGRKFGEVELAYGGRVAGEDDFTDDFSMSVTDIAGRTIHSDGKVIPFTGKPYQRTVERSKGVKVTQKVFALPDVEVGSILEYRYKLRIPDNWYASPDWYIQQDIYVRKGHYDWKATDLAFVNRLTGNISQGISWSAVLPQGTAVKSSMVPQTSGEEGYEHMVLDVHDVMPIQDEEFMPPLRSTTYRVNFYYAFENSAADFWKDEGKAWARSKEHFIGSTGSLKEAAETLVAPGDSDTVKLQKIYAAVMTLDNTSYSRQHDAREDKAKGLKEVKTAQDIWQRKSGVDDQIADLFVGLARAAGMKAYVMRVTDRDKNTFYPAWLSFDQLDDDIAIVVLDGKEQYFDPGQRDCPFGQMAWKHTDTSGLRELENGSTAIARTPESPYTQSQTQRIADLTMDADGTAQGTVKISWTGAPALAWRQQALRKDADGMEHAMQDWLKEKLPAGLEPELPTVDNLSDYEKPLVAHFNVHGPLATVTAKRLILPGQLFEVNSKPRFPHPTRDIPVYFNHGEQVNDVVRVKCMEDVHVESAPKADSFLMQQLAGYQSQPQVQGNTILMRRAYNLGAASFLPKEYGDVKAFYDKIAVDDQQPIVLLTAGPK